MLLKDAEKVYIGSEAMTAIYLGATKVWPAEEAWTPASLPGLAVWLDATQTGATAGYWENLGSGPDGEIIGAPLPTVNTNALNGLPVMRFKPSEGRVRIASTGVHLDWTLIYIGRLTGPTPGRVIDAYYPPNNLLVGFWNGQQDVMYDNGFASNVYAPWTTNWKLYSGDGSDSPRESRLFSDGTLLGSTSTAAGWGGTFNISGYAVTEETCDCEIAEAVQYNRKLSDTDRQKVEDYLREKWF